MMSENAKVELTFSKGTDTTQWGDVYMKGDKKYIVLLECTHDETGAKYITYARAAEFEGHYIAQGKPWCLPRSQFFENFHPEIKALN